MNKGMALNIVVAIIIAIAGVSLLLLTMSGMLPDVSREAYCSAYTGIITVLPSPQEGGPRVPDYCLGDLKAKEKVFNTVDSEKTARSIAASTIACWEKVEKMGIRENHTCFDMSFPNGVPKVSEKDITKVMEEEGGCRYLQNQVYYDSNGQMGYSENCGDKDRIQWNVQDQKSLHGQKKVLIEYYEMQGQRFIVISG
ncbi:MAG: hypothetical protein ABEK17_02630 [Candidatus Aenigmatarchaeota archaeon]